LRADHRTGILVATISRERSEEVLLHRTTPLSLLNVVIAGGGIGGLSSSALQAISTPAG
jgi:hypothetical protein